MTAANIFQVSLQIWACIISIIFAIMNAKKAYNTKGPLGIIWVMLIINGFLLIFDSLSYIFMGETSTYGIIITRISNFMIFALDGVITFSIACLIHYYTKLENESLFKDKWFIICSVLILIQLIFLVITQFNGFYYKFDEYNNYIRSNGICVSFITLGMVCLICGIRLFMYRKRLSTSLFYAFSFSSIVFIILFFIQLFVYGLSLINIGITLFLLITLIAVSKDIDEKLFQTKLNEIENVIKGLVKDKKE